MNETKLLIWGIGIIFTLFIGYMSYLLFYPIKYFDTEQPYKVLNANKTVKVGEDLVYEATYCKYIDYIPQRVQRSLVNGFIYDLPISTSGNFPKGCHTVVVSVPMIVPPSLPINHQYKLSISVQYQLNPFRIANRTFISETFTLIK